MISIEEAEEQQRILKEMADSSPIRQYRYEMKRRWIEWRNAIADARASDGSGVIELAGSVTGGMQALAPTRKGDWGFVIRVLNRDSQVSIHIEDDDGRPVYLNFYSASSPVVVKA